MVPDTAAMTYDGLTVGYRIKSSKEKEVGNKGDFSRYSVEFYIVNNTYEAKIFLYNQGWQIANDVSPYVVQFDILNATGARFTSKMVQLQLAPCEVLGIVQDKNTDKDKNSKSGNKQFVKIGYWIRPGETIRTSAVLIVPLNELPSVKATMYPNMNAKIPANAL